MICNKCGVNEANTHLCQNGETKLISKLPLGGWNCSAMCGECAEKALSGTFCTHCGQEIGEQRVTVQVALIQTAEGQWVEESKSVTAHCPNCRTSLGRPAHLDAQIVIG